MRLLPTLIVIIASMLLPAVTRADELVGWQRLGDTISGPPVVIGKTPSARLLGEVAEILGLAGSDLRLLRSHRQGALHQLEYRQHFDNRPVLDSTLRLVIGRGRLVAAFGQGARRAKTAWPLKELPAAQAFLSEFDGASVVDQRFGWITIDGVAVPAIAIDADDIAPEQKATLTYDLLSGECIRRKSRIMFCNICGSTHGVGTVGFDQLDPDADSLPLPLPHRVLNIAATSDSIVTESDGTFDWDSSSSVSLSGTLSGLFVDVLDDDGPELSIDTGPIAPGSPVELILNEDLIDTDTAEVNAYVHVNRMHDWFTNLPLDPPFTSLDFPLQVRVNRQLFGSCNAAYDPAVPELFFLPAGGGCPNSAYSSVIYHEYMHAIVFEVMGGFPDLDLNEGLADAGSTLLTGHRLVGRNFYGLGSHLRDLEIDLIHPVFGDIWTRGRVVAGSFFDLRTRLIHELGPFEGQALAEELFAKSLYFMPDSIGDAVVTAVLLADDDNADLTDGTPHAAWILECFQIHGLQDQTMALEPIRGLADQITSGLVTFTWFSTSSYDEVTVERDGGWIATLPGDATFFIDEDPPPGLHTYLFTAGSGGLSSPGTPILIPIDEYRRGDTNLDRGIDLDDVFVLLDQWFAGTTLSCPDAADVDDDGAITLSDAILLLEYLFRDGIEPAAPFEFSDLDPTVDFLPCAGEL